MTSKAVFAREDLAPQAADYTEVFASRPQPLQNQYPQKTGPDLHFCFSNRKPMG